MHNFNFEGFNASCSHICNPILILLSLTLVTLRIINDH